MESGSQINNTNIMDRGYFLGSVLKHIDDSIWEKVDKDLFMRKFSSIGIDCTFEEVSSVWGPQILAE